MKNLYTQGDLEIIDCVLNNMAKIFKQIEKTELDRLTIETYYRISEKTRIMIEDLKNEASSR